jgi:hypothetical protein
VRFEIFKELAYQAVSMIKSTPFDTRLMLNSIFSIPPILRQLFASATLTLQTIKS